MCDSNPRLSDLKVRALGCSVLSHSRGVPESHEALGNAFLINDHCACQGHTEGPPVAQHWGSRAQRSLCEQHTEESCSTQSILLFTLALFSWVCLI